MKWYKSCSNTEPKEIETGISRKYNYVRRNIQEEDGMYKYEECKITKEDWGWFLELQETKAALENVSEALDFVLMGGE